MSYMETGEVYRGDLEKLIDKVGRERAIDLAQYRRPYLERRIATRLRVLGLHTYRQYAEHLDGHLEEYGKLFDALTIGVTGFYRDSKVFDLFRERIVPDLVERACGGGRRTIRAWSAGCATGEETYSIAMSLMEGIARADCACALRAVGTDLDETALARARTGEYALDKVEGIPEAHRVEYLEEGGETFRISSEVREHVDFRLLNLFADKPIRAVDIIFCRNVFIYFTREQQDAILGRFLSALNRGGYLVLGRSEKLSRNVAGCFETISARDRVYRKSDSAKVSGPPRR